MTKDITVITAEGNFTAESFLTDGDNIVLKNVFSSYENKKFIVEKNKSLPLRKVIDIFVG